MPTSIDLRTSQQAPTESCASCTFFVRSGDSSGTCHRNPPTVLPSVEVQGKSVAGVESVWPVVDAGDWCGEFKQSGQHPTRK